MDRGVAGRSLGWALSQAERVEELAAGAALQTRSLSKSLLYKDPARSDLCRWWKAPECFATRAPWPSAGRLESTSGMRTEGPPSWELALFTIS